MHKSIRKLRDFLADDTGSVPIEYLLVVAPTAGLFLLSWLRMVAGMASTVAAENS